MTPKPSLAIVLSATAASKQCSRVLRRQAQELNINTQCSCHCSGPVLATPVSRQAAQMCRAELGDTYIVVYVPFSQHAIDVLSPGREG